MNISSTGSDLFVEHGKVSHKDGRVKLVSNTPSAKYLGAISQARFDREAVVAFQTGEWPFPDCPCCEEETQ